MSAFPEQRFRTIPQLALCASLLYACGTMHAQQPVVQFSPASLYFSDSRQSMQITLTSASAQPMELNLSVVYGYGSGTDTGKDEEGSARYAKSCASWVSCQPSSLRLEGGTSATVDIAAVPPPGLKDGEYWGRVVVRSGEGASATELAQIPLAYRKGDTYADVKLAGTKVMREGDTVQLIFDFQQLGNSAYHGNLALVVRNAKGKELHKEKMQISVYETSSKRFDIPGKSMPPGVYKATLNFDAERPDLGDAALLVLPKNYTVEFRLP
jgi:hypothetical protein